MARIMMDVAIKHEEVRRLASSRARTFILSTIQIRYN